MKGPVAQRSERQPLMWEVLVQIPLEVEKLFNFTGFSMEKKTKIPKQKKLGA